MGHRKSRGYCKFKQKSWITLWLICKGPTEVHSKALWCDCHCDMFWHRSTGRLWWRGAGGSCPRFGPRRKSARWKFAPCIYMVFSRPSSIDISQNLEGCAAFPRNRQTELAMHQVYVCIFWLGRTAAASAVHWPRRRRAPARQSMAGRTAPPQEPARPRGRRAGAQCWARRWHVRRILEPRLAPGGRGHSAGGRAPAGGPTLRARWTPYAQRPLQRWWAAGARCCNRLERATGAAWIRHAKTLRSSLSPGDTRDHQATGNVQAMGPAQQHWPSGS